jgi:hypothetical protein
MKSDWDANDRFVRLTARVGPAEPQCNLALPRSAPALRIDGWLWRASIAS